MLFTKIAATLTVLLLFSGVVASIFGDPHPQIANRADIISGLCMISGVVCFIIAVVLGIWGL